MANRVYNLKAGGMHEAFMNSRAKIRVIGGGFGNGKTAATCVETIKIVKDYPGCNVLMARETFPKLNDTLRKEFKFWCPPSMFYSFPESKNSDNIAKFNNKSLVNFRYIAQQGKGTEQSTSNLLSATYDLVCVDQLEDPGITHKDFLDLLGRLRGNTVYRGTDATMPKSGPRMMILTCNPTSNWVYKRIVKPYHVYMESKLRCEEQGMPYRGNVRIHDDLLCERDPETGMAKLDIDGLPILMMELFEASTYENKENLGADFIATLESTYKGQMKDRFLLGQWASYEGMIYPDYAQTVHSVNKERMEAYYWSERSKGRIKNFIEGYDYGIASPSCYLFGFVDYLGIVHVLDGFHEREFPIGHTNAPKCQVGEIDRIRAKYKVDDEEVIFGDPSIFVRKSSEKATKGVSTAGLFDEFSDGRITFTRGNNDIMNGIAKVNSYLAYQPSMRNPYTGEILSPLIFFAEDLDFLEEEFTTYRWAKDQHGQPIDKPIDENDHAMDTLKYMLTEVPTAFTVITEHLTIPAFARWQVMPDAPQTLNGHRHG